MPAAARIAPSRAFVPYWVNFHAEHHLFMHVPCWRLPALHRALRVRPEGARMAVSEGYAAVLRQAAGRVTTARP